MEKITNTGLKIREGWQKLADRHELEISHWGIPALAGFTIKEQQSTCLQNFNHSGNVI